MYYIIVNIFYIKHFVFIIFVYYCIILYYFFLNKHIYIYIYT